MSTIKAAQSIQYDSKSNPFINVGNVRITFLKDATDKVLRIQAYKDSDTNQLHRGAELYGEATTPQAKGVLIDDFLLAVDQLRNEIPGEEIKSIQKISTQKPKNINHLLNKKLKPEMIIELYDVLEKDQTILISGDGCSIREIKILGISPSGVHIKIEDKAKRYVAKWDKEEKILYIDLNNQIGKNKNNKSEKI